MDGEDYSPVILLRQHAEGLYNVVSIIRIQPF
jgi:hypothetical protein